jgi:high affinity Mn2+ porin
MTYNYMLFGCLVETAGIKVEKEKAHKISSAWMFMFGLALFLCSFCAKAESVVATAGTQFSEQGAVPPVSPQEDWNIHGQLTTVAQWHPAFNAPYSGQNSLNPGSNSNETTDLTLYAGYRLSANDEIWINPELDQGFGLSNTLGMAGYPSGEAYKVGANTPYWRLPRLFYRKTIDLGGAPQEIESAANQFGGTHRADSLVVTAGKFSVVDVFDTNSYAHDPRTDFMNWSLVEAGAFDYAADAWGYTNGISAEWTQSWWTLRGGFFELSKVPNSTRIDPSLNQYEVVTELEERHQFEGYPGKLKFLLFTNRGKMGSYADAVQLARQTNSTPDTALVRRYGSNTGFAINLEQQLTSRLGAFARVSNNEGAKEAFEFTEINKSVSAGLSMDGSSWGRSADKLGAAVAVNGLSGAARQYFAAGGMGILIGDGQLNYGLEKISEVYYSWSATREIQLSLDCQYVVNPAYNRDRGPVAIYGMRIHGAI